MTRADRLVLGDADDLSPRTVGDLAARAPQLRLGAVPEFVKRSDGLPGLQRAPIENVRPYSERGFRQSSRFDHRVKDHGFFGEFLFNDRIGLGGHRV